jgi:hypothetical protein
MLTIKGSISRKAANVGAFAAGAQFGANGRNPGPSTSYIMNQSYFGKYILCIDLGLTEDTTILLVFIRFPIGRDHVLRVTLAISIQPREHKRTFTLFEGNIHGSIPYPRVSLDALLPSDSNQNFRETGQLSLREAFLIDVLIPIGLTRPPNYRSPRVSR